MAPLMLLLYVFQVSGFHFYADVSALRKLPLIPKAYQHSEGKRSSHTWLGWHLQEEEEEEVGGDC